MKTQKQHRMIILLILLLLSPTAQGQEFTKVIPLQKSRDMIVRDYTGDRWIVYNRYLSVSTSNLESVFLMVPEVGSSATMLTLPSSIRIVNDFEVYNDYVYFCGQNWDYQAVMGIFPLQAFPNVEVCIWTLPEMYSFNKLDVGELDDNVLHVMMTGEAALGSTHIVDAKNSSLNIWHFNISLVMDGWIFDDVAITTSKVVFSARQKKDNADTLIEFPYPGTSSTILPGYSIPYVIVPLANKILLKASSSARYAFLTNTGFGPLAGEVLGLAPVWQTLMGNGVLPSSVHGNDIAFNPIANRVDILTTGVSGTTSCILHPYEITIMPVPPVLDGHGVTEETILSVDGIRNAGGLFIAAGNAVTLDFLNLYRYRYNAWQDCFEEKQNVLKKIDKWDEIQKFDVSCRELMKEAECGFCETGEITVFNECN